VARVRPLWGNSGRPALLTRRVGNPTAGEIPGFHPTAAESCRKSDSFSALPRRVVGNPSAGGPAGRSSGPGSAKQPPGLQKSQQVRGRRRRAGFRCAMFPPAEAPSKDRARSGPGDGRDRLA
jgi:hypothetical protein